MSGVASPRSAQLACGAYAYVGRLGIGRQQVRALEQRREKGALLQLQVKEAADLERQQEAFQAQRQQRRVLPPNRINNRVH